MHCLKNVLIKYTIVRNQQFLPYPYVTLSNQLPFQQVLHRTIYTFLVFKSITQNPNMAKLSLAFGC